MGRDKQMTEAVNRLREDIRIGLQGDSGGVSGGGRQLLEETLAKLDAAVERPKRDRRRRSGTKPPKPYVHFPLFAHSRGYWCKTIDGKHENFGAWEWPDPEAYKQSWEAALDAYQRQVEERARGVAIRRPDQLTLDNLVDAYLTFKHEEFAQGKIEPRTFAETREVCTCFRDQIGPTHRVRDLEQRADLVEKHLARLGAAFGWYRYNKHVVLLRGMFNWAARPMVAILDQPFRLVSLFKKREEKVLRKDIREREAQRGPRMFGRKDIQAMIEMCNPIVRAQILLGYFCAYGNTDCSDLPINAVNFSPDEASGVPDGWAEIVFPRPKTEINRAALIPPVVVQALQVAISLRPRPVEARWEPHLFLTRFGQPYVRDNVHFDQDGSVMKVVHIDSINLGFQRLRVRMKTCAKGHVYTDAAAGCVVCRKELERVMLTRFYDLRGTAITDAGGCTDPDALSRWQGHSLAGMRRFYVRRIEAPKLKMIAETLHVKLFGTVPEMITTS